jgi:hypothetical protein
MVVSNQVDCLASISFLGSSNYRPSPDLETFITNVTAAISDLSDKAKRLEVHAEEIRQQAVKALKELINRVEELMSVAEVALFSFPENDPRFEESRLQSLDSMRAVGRASFKVKELAFGKLQSECTH